MEGEQWSFFLSLIAFGTRGLGTDDPDERYLSFLPLTLIRSWFGVGCHFSLPGLQALAPGRDEDVYILRTLQSLEGEEYDFDFGCLFDGWVSFSCIQHFAGESIGV